MCIQNSEQMQDDYKFGLQVFIGNSMLARSIDRKIVLSIISTRILDRK